MATVTPPLDLPPPTPPIGREAEIQRLVMLILSQVAALMITLRQNVRAVRLLAAEAAGDVLGLPPDAIRSDEVEQALAAVRDALDERAFADSSACSRSRSTGPGHAGPHIRPLYWTHAEPRRRLAASGRAGSGAGRGIPSRGSTRVGLLCCASGRGEGRQGRPPALRARCLGTRHRPAARRIAADVRRVPRPDRPGKGARQFLHPDALCRRTPRRRAVRALRPAPERGGDPPCPCD